VGASRDALPKNIPAGWDFEKIRYLPGIFDSVELILSDTPHIVRVQAAPDLTNQTVRVQVVVRNVGPDTKTRLDFTVRQAKSGKVAGSARSEMLALDRNDRQIVETRIPIKDCRNWSPDDPFLYELETSTGADHLSVRFGMREFHFDQSSGRAYLNGRPFFLRGSNVTLYRFFEDPNRGDRPWREEWVRRLHRKFKEMHWDALRYCIGFPPEMWYRVADEEGFLIQDEFPIWHLGDAADSPKRDKLAREYAQWMRERWNHPCVVIWDAQNETRTEETGAAIQKVRRLDLSNRPWDNGWSPAQAPGDCFESHPYLFSNPNFRLADLARVSGVPLGNAIPNQGTNAIVINEYGWLWLNRDGTPTTLTRQVYANLLGPDATPAQRRHLYARYLAALTEFWRCHRACAGVLHFCGLGYSRPDGQTSDHFLDIEQLTIEPEFFTYVREAFAPVGLMINDWAEEMPPGEKREIPVIVINDLYQSWRGDVRLRLRQDSQVLWDKVSALEVPPLGKEQLTFTCAVPLEPGRYQIEAALLKPGAEPVRSLRDFEVLTPEQKKARHGLAVGKPVKASSSLVKDGVAYPAAHAADGRRDTRWSSEFSDPQWLAVDLGQVQTIARVELLWENAYAKAYAIEVSADGQNWQEVFRTANGDGGIDDIRFAPIRTRWVRLSGTKRGTAFGYSLWEIRVFAP
jgi:hypothetical protein